MAETLNPIQPIADGARSIAPLRDFVVSFGRLLDGTPDEPRLLAEGGALLGRLLARDDWLPDAFAQPHPERYQQFLLHADSTERFSVVSFVWGPGQSTPIHDHTVWGLVGVLRGAEESQRFVQRDGRWTADGEAARLLPGDVEPLSPTVGDVHRVRNLFDDRISVSIHVYGANIGAVRRHTYPAEGGRKLFVSGYSNALLPNLWDRSAEMRGT
ncbi:cysteine dioxygenase [Paracidovorax cattleyae]|uniref:Predicted metal-dependent enzyme of the double-stranded beta helix superfamily n=1 Tax=Paracidovorax cattleyae TaxID=80868 RepID=A0A1H0WP14_9BURK|nr:cysteine dioxygenase [Paracidovorax cattleyae]SDP92417.1 Predicted metal-dependent enzyme of the double-stranded beta helix superfamily [Paracidovorax cattleyae]